MRNVGVKFNGVSNLDAEEFNKGFIEDLENAVLAADIVLDPANGPDTRQNMLAEAMTKSSQGAASYEDGGAADSYVLSRLGKFVQPSDYFDGMVVIFKAGNTNTGTSTVNVSGLGVKNIRDGSGGAVAAGEIQADSVYILMFDTDNDWFVLVNPSTDSAEPFNPNRQITFQNSTTDAEHDITFSGGQFFLDDDIRYATAPARTKRLDANFTFGDNQGGLDVGTVAPNTFYHSFAISNTGGGTADYLFSLSRTAPTMPSGFTQKRYLGKFVTNADSNIAGFSKNGSETLLDFPYTIHSETDDLSAGSKFASSLPLGDGSTVILNCLYDYATNPGGFTYVSVLKDETGATSADFSDIGIASGVLTGNVASVNSMRVALGDSSDLRVAASTGAIVIFNAALAGWVDPNI